MVLRGEGEEAFCAGYDIGQIPAGGSGEAQVLLSSNPFDDMILAVESFPTPVIAMLNGFAFGGGLEMAIACDIRIASDQAVFGMTPARLGVIYRPAGLMRFVNTIGLPATKELFYTARKVSARRAEGLKLVNRVCRITSYNVCYTKLLRTWDSSSGGQTRFTSFRSTARRALTFRAV